MEKDKRIPEENREDVPEEYQFLNQVIRKKPADRRGWFVRAAGLVLGAVLFGVIAAVVFVLTLRYTAGFLGLDLDGQRISIAGDEEQTDTAEAAETAESETVSETSVRTESSITEDETASASAAGNSAHMIPEAGNEASPEPEQDPAAAGGTETENPGPEQSLPVTPVVSGSEDSGYFERAEAVYTAVESLSSQSSVQSASAEDSGQNEADVPDQDAGYVLPSQEKSEGTHGADDREQGMAPDEPADPAEAEQALTLDAYRRLYQDMLDVAQESERAIVQVTGISSEMDYFNQNYENRRQLSGLAIARSDESLFILTEYRVAENVERILITFYDGTMADANYQKSDLGTGLTILKVPLDSIREETLENLQTAPLGKSGKVIRGEPVLALGSPLGYSDSVAYGVITSVTNSVSGIDAQYQLLLTDIEGSREGSGILVNLDGNVIGIIAQQYTGDNGTITALAISNIKPLIEKLTNNEILPLIGLTGQNVTQELTDRTGIPKGLLVTAVEPDSPAMLAGIKEYDILIRINDRPVSTMKDYQRIVSSLEPDENVSVIAMRKGAEGYREISFTVACGSQ